MSGRVAGKTVVVTGAAGGIGAAAGLRLAAEGAHVVITDIDADAGRAVAERVRTAGGAAEFRRHDVRDESSWEELEAALRADRGGLDVLVNNAAIYLIRPLAETSLEDWNRLFSVNVTGTFLGMKHCAPMMADRGGGAIVNVSSLAGLRGAAGHTLYGATKGAVRQMTKDVAAEYASANVRVNSVHPGYVRTPMADYAAAAFGVDRDALAGAASPLGRLAEPDDVAHVMVLLASDEGSYLNGGEIVVDGGASTLISPR